MSSPDPKAVLDTAVYYDFRPAAGDARLADALREAIVERLPQHKSFLSFLARESVSGPSPLGMLWGIAKERDGRFDVKARGLHPLLSATRVLALELGVRSSETIDRLRGIRAAAPNLEELSRAIETVYMLLLQYRAMEGFRRGDSGRYLELDPLDRFERKALRDALSIVVDTRYALRSRYRLDYMR